jgi:two-component system, cell cycle sensor histidine kinase and response regulator CckA
MVANPRSEASGPAARTVLVVEDEALVRAATRRILEMAGHRVLLADDARSALRIHSEQVGKVNLVVADLTLPEMSGQELGRRLRDVDRALPILYLSGYPSSEVDLDERSAFLAKPFLPETLLAEARRLLGR